MSNTGVLWLTHCAKVSGRCGIEESLGEKGSFAEKAELDEGGTLTREQVARVL